MDFISNKYESLSKSILIGVGRDSSFMGDIQNSNLDFDELRIYNFGNKITFKEIYIVPYKGLNEFGKYHITKREVISIIAKNRLRKLSKI